MEYGQGKLWDGTCYAVGASKGVRNQVIRDIYAPVYSASILLPWIPENNPLFEVKNDDIGPKACPIISILPIIVNA